MAEEQHQDERHPDELSKEELEELHAEELPQRQALSVLRVPFLGSVEPVESVEPESTES